MSASTLSSILAERGLKTYSTTRNLLTFFEDLTRFATIFHTHLISSTPATPLFHLHELFTSFIEMDRAYSVVRRAHPKLLEFFRDTRDRKKFFKAFLHLLDEYTSALCVLQFPQDLISSFKSFAATAMPQQIRAGGVHDRKELAGAHGRTLTLLHHILQRRAHHDTVPFNPSNLDDFTPFPYHTPDAGIANVSKNATIKDDVRNFEVQAFIRAFDTSTKLQIYRAHYTLEDCYNAYVSCSVVLNHSATSIATLDAHALQTQQTSSTSLAPVTPRPAHVQPPTPPPQQLLEAVNTLTEMVRQQNTLLQHREPLTSATAGMQPRMDIKCFTCGGDHMQRNCPQQQPHTYNRRHRFSPYNRPSSPTSNYAPRYHRPPPAAPQYQPRYRSAHVTGLPYDGSKYLYLDEAGVLTYPTAYGPNRGPAQLCMKCNKRHPPPCHQHPSGLYSLQKRTFVSRRE